MEANWKSSFSPILQISQICSQGLREAIAEAKAAFPELSVLEDFLEVGQKKGQLPSAVGPPPVQLEPEPPVLEEPELPAEVQPDPAMINTLLQLLRSQTEQTLLQEAAPGPSPAMAAPQLSPEHVLQQYLTAASHPEQWNAPYAASDRMPASLSAPSAVGLAGRNHQSYNHAGGATNFQMEQEYANLGKRQRLTKPGDLYSMHTHASQLAPEKRCSNCRASNTPFWRKDRNSKLSVCNACGLYAAKNDHPRPFRLWKEGQNVDHLIAAEAAAAATAGSAGAAQQQQQQQQEGGTIAGINFSIEDMNNFRSAVVAAAAAANTNNIHAAATTTVAQQNAEDGSK
jgi:hypothetical protein